MQSKGKPRMSVYIRSQSDTQRGQEKGYYTSYLYHADQIGTDQTKQQEKRRAERKACQRKVSVRSNVFMPGKHRG